MKYLVSFIIILVYTIINQIITYYNNKNLIQNNIDLFIKKHEQQVIHEVNNSLFKKEEELIDEI